MSVGRRFLVTQSEVEAKKRIEAKKYSGRRGFALNDREGLLADACSMQPRGQRRSDGSFRAGLANAAKVRAALFTGSPLAA